MAYGLNNFFQSLGGTLGNAFGNPQSGQKPGIPPNPNGSFRTELVDGRNIAVLSGPWSLLNNKQWAGFLTPTTLLSSVYISVDKNSRTSGIAGGFLTNPTQFTPSPLVSLNESRRTGDLISQSPGFTPIGYYKTEEGQFKILPPNKLRTFDTANKDSQTQTKQLDERGSQFKFKLSDYVSVISKKNDFETSDGGGGNKPWEKPMDVMKNKLRDESYNGTPTDNEDPVYFGFEVIINVNTSPLFNGEIEKFISVIGGSYSEVGSREEIVRQFQFELQKYFKLDSALTAVGGRTEQYLGTSSIPEPNNLKRYYVKKLSGINLLVEANTGSTRKSFVDYGKDIIKITFYEDTTLNLGRLAAYYKLLYWSRLRGKSIIPENLLRFDCEIIISELRNFVKVRKSNDMLEVLKSNLSRYRYQVYECQLWFNKMSHPDDIDMSQPPTLTDTYDVEMTFKYSTMVYEQFEGKELKLRNSSVNPLSKVQSQTPESPDGFEKDRDYIPSSIFENNPRKLKVGEHKDPIEVNPQSNTQIDILNQNDKNNIYNGPAGQKLDRRKYSIYGRFDDSSVSTDIYGRAAEQLVENLKDAALREAQRQLNIRFRLLNNSIDNIRNAFGIGRIPAPKNVYFPKQNTGPYGNSQFFFDVQNSLRNFAGDTLTGLIGGG
jgi:hypothetical protein